MVFLTVFVVAQFLAVCQSYSVMYLENNAYKNMVITIGEGVKQDWKLVDRIKEVFGNGSEFLYNATRYGNIRYIESIAAVKPKIQFFDNWFPFSQTCRQCTV